MGHDKTDDFFKSDIHTQIEDELVELIEGQELGALDGSSSGAHQFDLNFFDVEDFDKTKRIITEFFKAKYPQIQFVVSDDYETTFDQL